MCTVYGSNRRRAANEQGTSKVVLSFTTSRRERVVLPHLTSLPLPHYSRFRCSDLCHPRKARLCRSVKTGKRVQFPRCRATVSEDIALGHWKIPGRPRTNPDRNILTREARRPARSIDLNLFRVPRRMECAHSLFCLPCFSPHQLSPPISRLKSSIPNPPRSPAPRCRCYVVWKIRRLSLPKPLLPKALPHCPCGRKDPARSKSSLLALPRN